MQFKICPDCGNDKLKTKATPKRIYDPATTRVTVEEEIAEVEYHCHQCGWTVMLEADAMDVPELAATYTSQTGQSGRQSLPPEPQA